MVEPRRGNNASSTLSRCVLLVTLLSLATAADQPLSAPSQLQRHIVTNVEAALRAELKALQISNAFLDCSAVPPQLPLLVDLGLQTTCLSKDSTHAAPGQRLALVYAVPQGTDRHGAGTLLRQFSSGLPYGATVAVQLRLQCSYSLCEGTSAAVFLTNATGVHRLLYNASAVHRGTFEGIYKHNLWGNKGDAGGLGSGPGSSFAQTRVLRTRLVELIRQYNISSMLDSSCGSMHWMPLVLEQLPPRFKFLGLDVACSWIKRHQHTFRRRFPLAQFACLDYAHEPLPSGYELVLSRDSLQHLPLYASWQFLHQVRNSGARFLLVGSYVRSPEANRLIRPGEYWSIDLLKPPFNLRPKPPLEVIEEGTPDRKHMLLLHVANMTWDEPLTYL